MLYLFKIIHYIIGFETGWAHHILGNIMKINSFDCDGVITLGIYPGPNDVIITGRSYEEEEETIAYLRSRGIMNEVIFNPLKFDEKTRETSGIHKANTINCLYERGISVKFHFEDDPIQINAMKPHLKNPVKIIRIDHDNEIFMENCRHEDHLLEN